MNQALLVVALLFVGAFAASSPCPGSSTLNSEMPSPFTRVLCYEQVRTAFSLLFFCETSFSQFLSRLLTLEETLPFYKT